MTGTFDGATGFVVVYDGADPIIKVYEGADLVADFEEEAAVAVTLGSIESSGPVTGTNWTYSTHDLAAEDDLIIVLFTARTLTAPESGVTYGGVAMTPFTTTNYADGTHVVWAYYLLQEDFPSVGDNKTVVVGHAGGQRGVVVTIACRGAAQEEPQQNGTSATGITSFGPTSVTVDEGAALFQVINIDDTNENNALAQGGAEVITAITEPLNSDTSGFSYTLDNAGPTASMSCSWTGNENGAQMVIGVNPA